MINGIKSKSIAVIVAATFKVNGSTKKSSLGWINIICAVNFIVNGSIFFLSLVMAAKNEEISALIKEKEQNDMRIRELTVRTTGTDTRFRIEPH